MWVDVSFHRVLGKAPVSSWMRVRVLPLSEEDEYLSVSRAKACSRLRCLQHRTARRVITTTPREIARLKVRSRGFGIARCASFSVDSRHLAPIHSFENGGDQRGVRELSMIMLLKSHLPARLTHSTELSA